MRRKGTFTFIERQEHPWRLFLAGKMLSHLRVAGFGKNLTLTPQGDTDSHRANVASRTVRNTELLLVAKLAVANLLGLLKCDTWFVQSPSKLPPARAYAQDQFKGVKKLPDWWSLQIFFIHSGKKQKPQLERFFGCLAWLAAAILSVPLLTSTHISTRTHTHKHATLQTRYFLSLSFQCVFTCALCNSEKSGDRAHTLGHAIPSYTSHFQSGLLQPARKYLFFHQNNTATL